MTPGSRKGEQALHSLENLEVVRVEQAFRPAVKADKMPASAAEVLLVDSLQLGESVVPIRPCTSGAKAGLFNILSAGLKACSTLCFIELFLFLARRH
jgi:hypothetical protein